MPSSGFHSEWITIKDHRILLECRASFPNEHMRLISHIAAEICDNNSEVARVVQVSYDNKSGMYTITIASTSQGDKKLKERLVTVFDKIFNNGNHCPEVIIVKPGDTSSDHYYHMEHLSVEAGIAVDRFRHRDNES